MGVCWWRKFGRQEGNWVSLWGVWNLAEVVRPFDFGPESQNQVENVGGVYNENNLRGHVAGQRHLGNPE